MSGTDVRNALDILGACPGSLSGKSRFYNRPHLKTDDSLRVGEIVHIDFFFMPGAWLIAVDNYSGHISCITRRGKKIIATFRSLIQDYFSCSHSIYPPFGSWRINISCIDFLKGMAFEIHPTVTYRHEPIAERGIETLKSRFRATLLSLPLSICHPDFIMG